MDTEDRQWFVLYALEVNSFRMRANLYHFVLSVSDNRRKSFAVQLVDQENDKSLEIGSWIGSCDSVASYRQIYPINLESETKAEEFLGEDSGSWSQTETVNRYEIQILSVCQATQQNKISSFATKFMLKDILEQNIPKQGGAMRTFQILRNKWTKWKVGLFFEEIDPAAKPDDIEKRVVNGSTGLLNCGIKILDKRKILQSEDFKLNEQG
jgi:hypothetical protein